MASKSVNRIENPPRGATKADLLESNPEPATAVIPRVYGTVIGAITGGRASERDRRTLDAPQV